MALEDVHDHGPPRYRDAIHYPESDDMGESGLQTKVRWMLMALLESFFVALGRKVLIGGDQFFYYREGDPKSKVAPDIYVVEDEDTPIEEVRSWKLWEHEGKAPSLAVEVVSREYRKDYEQDFLARYEALGVRELFRYDPERVAAPPPVGRRERRSLLTHFVRNEAGQLVAVPLEAPGRARSAVYDFWLVHVSPSTLRIGTGPLGEALWPTHEERAELESRRAEEESRRAEEESRRAEEESRRAERAEEELARLRAELESLRRGS